MDFVMVGEAAFALDPLSSQGIQSALGSAYHSALAVHTLRRRPSDVALADSFYRGKVQETSARYAALSGAHYRRAWYAATDPFWQARGVSGPESTPLPDPKSSLAPGRYTRVALSPEARLENIPCIIGDYVTAQPAIHHPSLSRPVAFLNDIPLGPVYAHCAPCQTVDSLTRRWRSLLLPHQIAPVLCWMFQQDILVRVP